MQNWSNDEVKEHIRKLLRVLCEPTTPTTTQEVFSRLMTFDLDVIIPIIENELDSLPDVVRLLLGVIIEISDHYGLESIRGLVPRVTKCLYHEDRLVRVAAIQVVREARIVTPNILDALRQRILDDEPPIQREAAVTLIELDDSLIGVLPQMFGDTDQV